MNQALYKAVKTHVLNQVYSKPGEVLSERKLADQFKVSRSPIREALRTLEQEGFIKVVPHRGAFLINLTLEDIREIFELRVICPVCILCQLDMITVFILGYLLNKKQSS